EHNPLSLLGTCDTTPGRTLNDPGPLTADSTIAVRSRKLDCPHHRLHAARHRAAPDRVLSTRTHTRDRASVVDSGPLNGCGVRSSRLSPRSAAAVRPIWSHAPDLRSARPRATLTLTVRAVDQSAHATAGVTMPNGSIHAPRRTR